MTPSPTGPCDAEQRLGALVVDYADLLLLLERTSILREVARRVRSATGADVALVGQVEGDGVVVLRNVAGTRTPSLQDVVVPSGFGLGGKVLADLRPHRVDDYVTSGSITHHYDAQVMAEGLRTMLAVPVVGPLDTDVHGVLYAALRESRPLGGRAVVSLRGVADAAATALTASNRAAARSAVDVESMRRDVASHLHDSVGALLFRIGAEVRDLSSEYTISPALTDRLQRVEAQVTDAAALLRECLTGLHQTHPGLELPTVLHADCDAFERRTGTRCRLVMLGEVPACDDARHDLVIRVVRECLLNAEKHAQADSVVVTLAASEGVLVVTVSDDGIGPAETHQGAAPDGQRLGLAALTDAAGRVGATLELLANDDRGATARLRVPGWSA